MTIAFDKLAYSKRLREAGVAESVADAHAMALRDFLLDEVATKTDLKTTEERINHRIDTLEEHINHRIDDLENRLTIKLGGMIIAAATVLAILQKILWHRSLYNTDNCVFWGSSDQFEQNFPRSRLHKIIGVDVDLQAQGAARVGAMV